MVFSHDRGHGLGSIPAGGMQGAAFQEQSPTLDIREVELGRELVELLYQVSSTGVHPRLDCVAHFLLYKSPSFEYLSAICGCCNACCSIYSMATLISFVHSQQGHGERKDGSCSHRAPKSPSLARSSCPGMSTIVRVLHTELSVYPHKNLHLEVNGGSVSAARALGDRSGRSL